MSNEAFLICWIIVFTGDFFKLRLGRKYNLTVNGQKLTWVILGICLSEWSKEANLWNNCFACKDKETNDSMEEAVMISQIKSMHHRRSIWKSRTVTAVLRRISDSAPPAQPLRSDQWGVKSTGITPSETFVPSRAFEKRVPFLQDLILEDILRSVISTGK